MKIYELTYIFSPESTSEEAETSAKNLEAFIQSKGGVILLQDKPNAKTLSYPIKKHASGFVGSVQFQTEPENLEEIKKNISGDGKIVRHMLIIKKPAGKVSEKRQRRNLSAPEAIQPKTEEKTAESAPAIDEKPPEKKVELKDIEQKLDEILGQ